MIEPRRDRGVRRARLPRRASIDEIARRSGVSAPVVYDHFASKQDLHGRLLERTRDELLEMWREHLFGDEPAEVRIPRALDAWARYVETHPYASRMFFREATGEPEVEAFQREVHAQARAALGAILGARAGRRAARRLRDPEALEMAAEVMRAGLAGPRDLVERPPARPARAHRRGGAERPLGRVRAGATVIAASARCPGLGSSCDPRAGQRAQDHCNPCRMLQIERATAAHLDAVRAIAADYCNLEEWPARPDALDFELRQGALWVALENGAVVGYAGVLRHGGIAHLADLFVARDRRGGGIGRQLLDAALPREGVRFTFASADERALPLYVRAGLRPLAPLLYLEGAARGRSAAVERIDVADVVARDAAASRRSRPQLLRFLAEAGAYALAAEPPGAYAVVRPAPAGAWLGPASAGAAELVAFAAAATAAHDSVKLALCGPHPALPPLLDAGFRLLGSDTYMASHSGVLNVERYLPEPDLG